MKKRLSVLLLIVMLGLCAGPVMAGGNEVNVVVNGVALAEKGLAVDGRTLVPLRAIGEAMGLQVDYWDGMIEVCNADKSLYLGMALGQKNVYVGSESKSQEIDVAPQAINGITMVPIRFIGDFFGSEVNWDQATKTVSVDGVKDAGGISTEEFEKMSPEEQKLMRELGEVQAIQKSLGNEKTVYRYAEGETDWAYLKERGYEILDYSIVGADVSVTIKNVGSDREVDTINVNGYLKETNKPLGYASLTVYDLPIGETGTFKVSLYEAFQHEAYITLGEPPC